MSSIRVSGNTSGYYDLTVPDVAGQNTIPLDRVVTTDTNGHIQISGGSTNNDDSAAVITAASTEHAKIRIDTSSTSNHRATLALESGSYEVNIVTSGLDEMRFSTQNTSDALFIGSNGRIGIGTTGPVEGLEVFGNNGADNMALKYSGTAGGHQSGYLWKDFRGQSNAGIYNNLQDDGVGSAAAQMEFYTSHAGTMTKQMEINRYGAVTKPNQPHWFGTNTNSYTTDSSTWITHGSGNNGGAGTGILKFNSAYASSGSEWNGQRYTATVAGLYYFDLTLDILNGSTIVFRGLKNGGRFHDEERIANLGSGWWNYNYSGHVYLNANDYFEVSLSNGTWSNIAGGVWSKFGIRLVL